MNKEDIHFQCTLQTFAYTQSHRVCFRLSNFFFLCVKRQTISLSLSPLLSLSFSPNSNTSANTVQCVFAHRLTARKRIHIQRCVGPDEVCKRVETREVLFICLAWTQERSSFLSHVPVQQRCSNRSKSFLMVVSETKPCFHKIA